MKTPPKTSLNPMVSRRRLLLGSVGAAGAVLGLPVSLARAESWPEKNVRVVIPFAPGGNVDVVARMMNLKLESEFGKSFVPENLSGASGAIGSVQVARAKPDGYTLLANSSIHVILPSVRRKLNYDVLKDFTPISQITEVPMVMMIGAEHPANSYAEFVAWAKEKKDSIDYATFFGSAGHLCAEQWKEQTGIPVRSVIYRDGTARSLDVSAGRVTFAFDALLSSAPYIRSGKLKAIAVTGSQRNALTPDIPTFAELKQNGVDATTWHGYWAPAGTPRPIVDKLGDVLARTAHSPDVVTKIQAMGGRVVGSRPEEFGAFCVSEKERFAALMMRSGIEPE